VILRRSTFLILIAAAWLIVATPSGAYNYFGYRWPNGTTSFYVDIPGADGLWDSTFEAAMAEWNSRSVFRYTVFRNQFVDPCNNQDRKNGVAFSETNCGTAFGSTTLAVTSTFSISQTATDTRILFNSNRSWNVYTGAWRNNVNDFRRVAVHELGHALGLDHESNVPAIMHPMAGNIEVPQDDDINGVNALYVEGGGSQDTAGPTVIFTSHVTGQTVTTASITIAGTATDAGSGGSGISSVTVNGIAANGGTASGSNAATWSRDIALTVGANLITVVANDGSSNRNATTRSIVINLAAPLTITSPSTLTGGTVGLAYTQTLTASGGAPPYSWSVMSGSVGAGLTLSTAGVLSGTPTSAGTFSFTARVTDLAGTIASKALQLTIATGGGSSTSRTATTYHVFPQFADGRLPDGTSYRSTLIVTNPGASTTCTLQLFGMTTDGSGRFQLDVPGAYTFSTSGTQSFQGGYATLQCSSPVEAQVLYSYHAANGAKLSEATVFSSPSAISLRIVSDAREGGQLGLAIANDSNQTGSYTIRVYDANGNQIGAPVITLGPKQSRAAFLGQLTSIPNGHYGIVDITATSGTASIIGLRYTGSVFTTIPATTMSSAGATVAAYHVFPQFADGRLPDGTSYRSTLIVTNPGSSTSCTLQLYGMTSDRFSAFQLDVPAANTFSTLGIQSFQGGYATLQCSSSVDAQVLYSYYAANGAKLSEATVFSSPSATSLRILSDAREGGQLGLAIANDSSQTGSYTIRVYDTSGNQIGAPVITLGPKQSRAGFLGQLTSIPNGHYGIVDITATSGTASIIGLRYTGSAFTTIPGSLR
jgi:hypothetical protein